MPLYSSSSSRACSSIFGVSVEYQGTSVDDRRRAWWLSSMSSSQCAAHAEGWKPLCISSGRSRDAHRYLMRPGENASAPARAQRRCSQTGYNAVRHVPGEAFVSGLADDTDLCLRDPQAQSGWQAARTGTYFGRRASPVPTQRITTRAL